MELIAVNYWAVLVAAAATMGLGGLWYGPLFGAKWRVLAGISLEEMRAMPLSPVQAMVGGFFTVLLMSYVLATVLIFGSEYTDTSGLLAGVSAGFWLWLGFALPLTAGSFLWEGKPLHLWLLNAGYYLVALLIMGSILALWP
jgi:hypothetical protein